MSRFLIVSLPLPGHVNPLSAVSAALAHRGHEVAWAGSEAFLRPILGPDATIFPIPLRAHRGQSERGMAATKSRWAGYIVPHARVTRNGVADAVRQFQPDAMLVDQHAVAGAIVAIHAGLPWASMAPTTMELTRPYRSLPRIETWIKERLAQMWTAAGMPGEPPYDLRYSPQLTIAFTGPQLLGTQLINDPSWPANVQLVGPALGHRPASTPFPWGWLDPDRRQVLVTMGTLSMDLARVFYQRVAEALRPLADQMQAIIIAPDGTLPDPDEHILRLPQAPVLELLPKLDAVVCHGGLNTVCESLLHGVPLVIAPIKGDQPVNAELLAQVGAGIRISFDRTGPHGIRDAVFAVLSEPTYRAAARRMGEDLRAGGGARAAAYHLELLTTAKSGN